ncbi:MAG: bifunctional adenosylcobinamide kinase/adenosylcobinamide-phosphate guanylyltransferase [Thermodesulfobacteriota bacterium]|nr:bifunctional adenosylcobinamide kinase/adenosylcobinamide-phosphate guanylyltransferase [Thermodesulfobacteriota bacterium]
MAFNTLILGGAQSGKSKYALRLGEEYIKATTNKDTAGGLYVATAQPLDQEMEEKIQRHKLERGAQWKTAEEPTEVPDIIRQCSGSYPVILVDCLTLWMSNLMKDKPNSIKQSTEDLFDALSETTGPTIMVSNEIGLGLVPGEAMGRKYRDIAGRVHQRLAEICDRVVLVVAGLPLELKGNNNK